MRFNTSTHVCHVQLRGGSWLFEIIELFLAQLFPHVLATPNFLHTLHAIDEVVLMQSCVLKYLIILPAPGGGIEHIVKCSIAEEHLLKFVTHEQHVSSI